MTTFVFFAGAAVGSSSSLSCGPSCCGMASSTARSARRFRFGAASVLPCRQSTHRHRSDKVYIGAHDPRARQSKARLEFVCIAIRAGTAGTALVFVIFTKQRLKKLRRNGGARQCC